MRRRSELSALRLLLLVMLSAPFLPRAASGQGALPTLGGAAAGLVGGTLVTAGALALRAQGDLYLWDWADLEGWPAVPMVGGLVAGGVQGATDADALGRGVGWGAVGAVSGAALGWWLGPRIWDEARGRWAGMTVGLAGGLVTGWVIGSLSGDDDPEAPGAPALSFRIPLGR